MSGSKREVKTQLKKKAARPHKEEELKKAIEDFITTASHELRTPLTSIKGYVDAILQEEAGPLKDQQKEFLGYVRDSANCLNKLLNKFLIELRTISRNYESNHPDRG